MASPTGILFADPRVKPTSTVGQPQSGCYYCFFLTQTTTPTNVYADGLLTTPLSQPTPGSVNPVAGTVAASDGRFVPIYLNPATVYRAQLYSAAGLLLEDTDPYVTPSPSSAIPVFAQTASEIAAGVVPTNTYYLPGDIRRYGGVGNGVANDTTAVANAILSNTSVYVPYGYNFLITTVVLTTSVRLWGGGMISQSANPGVSMIYVPAANPGLSLDLEGVSFNGNQALQGATPQNFTIDFRSAGTSSAPTIFRCVGCTFTNGALADIRCFSNQTGGLIKAIITDNVFLGGISGVGTSYGPRYVDVADAVDLLLADNHFDFLQLPGSGVVGKAGLVTYYNQAESIPTPNNFSVWVRTIVTGNYFNYCGRDAANTQGPIDLYGYAVDAVISNNVIRNFAGRGICVKGTDPRAIISGNSVDTTVAGVVQASVGIVCNPSTTTDFYNDIIIDSNIVNNVSGYGILVSGLNTNLTAGTRQGVQISRNIIRNAATGGGSTADIYIQALLNVDIFGNQCFNNGGTAGCLGGSNNQGIITIKNNQFVSPVAYGVIFNSGDSNSLAYFEIDGNIVQSPGASGQGCAFYLSGIGGVNFGRANRIINPGNAVAILTDTSASVQATTAGAVMTISAVNFGIVSVGQLVSSAPGAGASLSIPGTFIASFGTFTNAVGSGTVNLSASPTNIPGSQAFYLTGVIPGTSEAAPRTLVLNNNTQGVVTATNESHFVDTASAAVTGNLYWINGGYPGAVVTFKPLVTARLVTFKDNAGNLATGNLNLGADFVPTTLKNSITLIYTGTDWEIVAKN